MIAGLVVARLVKDSLMRRILTLPIWIFSDVARCLICSQPRATTYAQRPWLTGYSRRQALKQFEPGRRQSPNCDPSSTCVRTLLCWVKEFPGEKVRADLLPGLMVHHGAFRPGYDLRRSLFRC